MTIGSRSRVAAAASFAALITQVGLAGTANPAGAASSVQSKAVGTSGASAPSLVSCSTATDYRLQMSAPIRSRVDGRTNGDVVRLYYSPSSRCVYGKYVADSACASGESCLGARVLRSDDYRTGWCNLGVGATTCATPKIYDGGTTAAAEGSRANHSQWYGKTGWW